MFQLIKDVFTWFAMVIVALIVVGIGFGAV